MYGGGKTKVYDHIECSRMNIDYLHALCKDSGITETEGMKLYCLNDGSFLYLSDDSVVKMHARRSLSTRELHVYIDTCENVDNMDEEGDVSGDERAIIQSSLLQSGWEDNVSDHFGSLVSVEVAIDGEGFGEGSEGVIAVDKESFVEPLGEEDEGSDDDLVEEEYDMDASELNVSQLEVGRKGNGVVLEDENRDVGAAIGEESEGDEMVHDSEDDVVTTGADFIEIIHPMEQKREINPTRHSILQIYMTPLSR